MTQWKLMLPIEFEGLNITKKSESVTCFYHHVHLNNYRQYYMANLQFISSVFLVHHTVPHSVLRNLDILTVLLVYFKNISSSCSFSSLIAALLGFSKCKWICRLTTNSVLKEFAAAGFKKHSAHICHHRYHLSLKFWLLWRRNTYLKIVSVNWFFD